MAWDMIALLTTEKEIQLLHGYMQNSNMEWLRSSSLKVTDCIFSNKLWVTQKHHVKGTPLTQYVIDEEISRRKARKVSEHYVCDISWKREGKEQTMQNFLMASNKYAKISELPGIVRFSGSQAHHWNL